MALVAERTKTLKSLDREHKLVLIGVVNNIFLLLGYMNGSPKKNIPETGRTVHSVEMHIRAAELRRWRG